MFVQKLPTHFAKTWKRTRLRARDSFLKLLLQSGLLHISRLNRDAELMGTRLQTMVRICQQVVDAIYIVRMMLIIC